MEIICTERKEIKHTLVQAASTEHPCLPAVSMIG